MNAKILKAFLQKGVTVLVTVVVVLGAMQITPAKACYATCGNLLFKQIPAGTYYLIVDGKNKGTITKEEGKNLNVSVSDRPGHHEWSISGNGVFEEGSYDCDAPTETPIPTETQIPTSTPESTYTETPVTPTNTPAAPTPVTIVTQETREVCPDGDWNGRHVAGCGVKPQQCLADGEYIKLYNSSAKLIEIYKVNLDNGGVKYVGQEKVRVPGVLGQKFDGGFCFDAVSSIADGKQADLYLSNGYRITSTNEDETAPKFDQSFSTVFAQTSDDSVIKVTTMGGNYHQVALGQAPAVVGDSLVVSTVGDSLIKINGQIYPMDSLDTEVLASGNGFIGQTDLFGFHFAMSLNGDVEYLDIGNTSFSARPVVGEHDYVAYLAGGQMTIGWMNSELQFVPSFVINVGEGFTDVDWVATPDMNEWSRKPQQYFIARNFEEGVKINEAVAVDYRDASLGSWPDHEVSTWFDRASQWTRGQLSDYDLRALFVFIVFALLVICLALLVRELRQRPTQPAGEKK